MKRLCALLTYALVAAAACSLTGCGHSLSVPPSGSNSVVLSATSSQTPLLPDPRLTPGATLPVTVQDISVPGYAHKVRDVPSDVKRQVYAEYGITSHPPGGYEVDHLISLELGGSNSIKNLWPQSYQTQPWNAHVKDKLENRLHDLVCSGQVPLATAQHDIAANWIEAYKKYMGVNAPAASGRFRTHASTSRAVLSSRDASSNQVWVNTHSGKYFHSGSRYYGHTREGQYMTEQAAQQQGYTAARGD